MGVQASAEEGGQVVAPSGVLDQSQNISNLKGVRTQEQETNDAELVSRLTENLSGGQSFKVCDINRLKRFIVLGSETNSYYSTKEDATIDNILCVKNLLSSRRHEEVLNIITEYSKSGRIPKEEPILLILAMCAVHEDLEVRKAAYSKVTEICNIPTKLFRFLQLTQDDIDRKRLSNPPEPQLVRNPNKRKRVVEKEMKSLSIEERTIKVEDDIIKEESATKEPSENVDVTLEPETKKGKKENKTKIKKEETTPGYKKVNKTASKSSGWGRMRRKSIAAFYSDQNKNAARLLLLVSKYRSRHDWNHKQVLTYAHPKIPEDEVAKHLVLKYATLDSEKVKEFCELAASKPGISEDVSNIVQYIRVIEETSHLDASKQEDENRMVEILEQYGVRGKPKEFAAATTFQGDAPKDNVEGKKSAFQIVREHLPTPFLKSKRVWEALLVDMPMTALIRNLGKMTSMQMFQDEKNVKLVVDSLTNQHKLKTARVHPVKILLALVQYKEGKGHLGHLNWAPNEKIAGALDDAFYLSFKQPELQSTFRTGKKFMLCLDVSGSMSFRGCVGTVTITPAMASAAMAWVTWNIEGDVDLVAFGSRLENMKDRGFNKDMKIDEVVARFSSISFGRTDCSLPMVRALELRQEVDVFIVYTDSETNCNRIPPAKALRDYNKAMNRNAKLIVCGLMSNGFTIADPHDAGMMDVVGFDANVPELISEFAMGRLSGVCSNTCPECQFKLK